MSIYTYENIDVSIFFEINKTKKYNRCFLSTAVFYNTTKKGIKPFLIVLLILCCYLSKIKPFKLFINIIHYVIKVFNFWLLFVG